MQADKIGMSGWFGFWVLGSSYIISGVEPEVNKVEYVIGDIVFQFLRCLRNLLILSHLSMKWSKSMCYNFDLSLRIVNILSS